MLDYPQSSEIEKQTDICALSYLGGSLFSDVPKFGGGLGHDK